MTEWALLFEATSIQELQAVVPTVGQLPDGTRGKFEVQGPGLGLLADLPGAELIWRGQLAGAGVNLLDVHGEGFSLAVLDWVVDSSLAQSRGHGQAGVAVAPLLIIAAVIAALLALNWVINSIKAFYEEVAEDVGGFLPVLLVGLGLAVAVAVAGFGASRIRKAVST